ncbi:hypothetical protein HMPREF1624_07705 [Sporothrix schenckii ATCC 58251]|uniref:Major facilitator superfamily (MFS) profile domain-containing protein n=1 Tax=Sporothrix schenckii (strain ATCC 58251 / de Perez 2211183) TaxID=1391915 RepID=U7PN45_SPOS1|nr:hypothetical protein HMPREF1624_07705 [Sporothrix schenckii ATCC 58251]
MAFSDTIPCQDTKYGNGDEAKTTAYDNNEGHSDIDCPDGGTAAMTGFVLDHKAERALCRKLDIRLLPVLAIMFLFNGLDKGNLSNAATAGMAVDLNLKGNEYNISLGIFYIPFVLTAPFLSVAGKKFGPSRVLPAMMLVFGLMTILMVANQSFAGMVALRWFLGMAESAFLPLIVYYLTTFYRRGELARRMSLFYASSNIANAFSGLLAYGVFHITNTPLQPWRYLFLIEGCVTIVFSVFTYFYLPLNPASAHFLSEAERTLSEYRIRVDSSAVVNQTFVLRDALQIFRQPVTYAFLAIEICLGVPLQSVALFLPQIVARLGYSAVKTNLYTVAPNICGAVVLILLCFSSDFTRLRAPFILIGFVFTLVGFIIYASIDVLDNLHVAYFATFLMCWGSGAPSILLCAWYNNNTPDEGRRMALTGVGVPLANLMGVVSSNIFTANSKPKYIPALATSAAFGATGAVLTSVLFLYMLLDNKRRDRKLGRKLDIQETPTELLKDGPSVPEFRWFL